MKCVIEHNSSPTKVMMVQSPRYGVNGTIEFHTETIVRCRTHYWYCDDVMYVIPPDGMCPVARVEAQMDAALAEIERRLKSLENVSVPSV